MPTRVLVTGVTGFLGPYVVAECERRGCEVLRAGRREADVALDFAEPGELEAAVAAVETDLILNLAALSSIGACAADPDLAERVNARSVAALGAVGRRLVQVSTDLVFDGREAPYLPTATTRPLSEYGISKLRGEGAALACANSLVVRLPLLFGPSADGRRGATDMLQAVRSLALFTNEHRTPIHAADAAAAVVEFGLSARTGIVQVAGPERVSRWEFARRYAAIHGIDSSAWWPTVAIDADRPRDVSMLSDWRVPRGLDAALADLTSSRARS